MNQYLVNKKLDQVCNRIDELCDGLTTCTDPSLNYNLQASIAMLIEEQSQFIESTIKKATS